jgi:hypothetical protein
VKDDAAMTWNYRAFKENGELTIREVYCDDDKAHSYTVKPVRPSGETEEELRKDLSLMLLALDKPVLTDKDFQSDLNKEDEHPMYRALFYIQETNEHVRWPEFIEYYRQQDREVDYDTYCYQMWSSYMDYQNINKLHPLSYREYIKKYKDLLEEGYNGRS